MSVLQVGLVDTTGTIDAELIESVAAALNIQVSRDLPQCWPVQATVRYLPSAKKIPAGVWPVKLVRSLPPGEGGFHLDKHNQPYAEVIATPHDESWSIDASHEIIEMLVDPAGNRMHSSIAIGVAGKTVEDTTGQFNYLVEACDPCEANQYGYEIQGVLVSDFITPHFYDPMAVPGTRYSFTGALTGPRQILPGGYISFINQESDEWEQILFLELDAGAEDAGAGERQQAEPARVDRRRDGAPTRRGAEPVHSPHRAAARETPTGAAAEARRGRGHPGKTLRALRPLVTRGAAANGAVLRTPRRGASTTTQSSILVAGLG